jgi:hypothetical protein
LLNIRSRISRILARVALLPAEMGVVLGKANR